MDWLECGHAVLCDGVKDFQRRCTSCPPVSDPGHGPQDVLW